MSDFANAGIATVALATLLQRTGRAAEAVEQMQSRFDAVDDWQPEILAGLRARCGAALADLGRIDEAQALLDSASQLDAELLGLCRAHLELARGDVAAARSRLDLDTSRSADLRLAVQCLAARIEGVETVDRS